MSYFVKSKTFRDKGTPHGNLKSFCWIQQNAYMCDISQRERFPLGIIALQFGQHPKPILNQCSACPALNRARDLEGDPYLEQVGEASNQELQSGHFLPLITSDDRKTPLSGKGSKLFQLGPKLKELTKICS